MGSIHVVVPDAHAHPDHNNKRAEWLGALIRDVRPDTVVNIGDTWDMPSLSSYDKNTKSFQGRRYAKDIDAGLDFQERLWSTVRKGKKKLPRRVFLVGNHEQRIERAINMQPELEGAIGYQDLDLERYYSDVVYYSGNTPGVIEIDGVFYAHYFPSGLLGKPISGEHLAYTLLSKKHASCTQGHAHILDQAYRSSVSGRKIAGLVAGVFQDYDSDWAGETNKLWWRGVVIKRGVEAGAYDPEFVSLERLKREYS